MEKIYIPILLGTAREGRRSEKVAHYVLDQAKIQGLFEPELFDVKDFVKICRTDDTEKTDEAKRWSEIMQRADGLLIVSPEYNHGYPGELKLMLDQIFDEYDKKPVGMCGVSSGHMGGARMVEALRSVFIALHMVPMQNAVYFSNAKNLFDEQGVIRDASYGDRLKKLFEELAWYANALKTARTS